MQRLENLIDLRIPVIYIGFATRAPVSDELWKSAGSRLFHSRAVERWVLQITLRCVIRASQIIIIKKRTAIKEIMEPIDEITFHLVYASG